MNNQTHRLFLTASVVSFWWVCWWYPGGCVSNLNHSDTDHVLLGMAHATTTISMTSMRRGGISARNLTTLQRHAASPLTATNNRLVILPSTFWHWRCACTATQARSSDSTTTAGPTYTARCVCSFPTALVPASGCRVYSVRHLRQLQRPAHTRSGWCLYLLHIALRRH